MNNRTCKHKFNLLLFVRSRHIVTRYCLNIIVQGRYRNSFVPVGAKLFWHHPHGCNQKLCLGLIFVCCSDITIVHCSILWLILTCSCILVILICLSFCWTGVVFRVAHVAVTVVKKFSYNSLAVNNTFCCNDSCGNRRNKKCYRQPTSKEIANKTRQKIANKTDYTLRKKQDFIHLHSLVNPWKTVKLCALKRSRSFC